MVSAFKRPTIPGQLAFLRGTTGHLQLAQDMRIRKGTSWNLAPNPRGSDSAYYFSRPTAPILDKGQDWTDRSPRAPDLQGWEP